MRKRKIKLTLFMLMSFCVYNNYTLAQNTNDGLYFDINFMSVNEHIEEYAVISWNPFLSERTESGNKKIELGLSFGFSGKINLSEIFSINYKPGITTSSDYYTFADFATSLRAQIFENIFTGIGISAKYCLTPREGNMSYSKPRSESFEYFVYCGYELNNQISLLLSANDSINDEYGEEYINSNMNSKYTRKYVYWLLKLGLEFKL